MSPGVAKAGFLVRITEEAVRTGLIDDFLAAKRAAGASEHTLSGYLAAWQAFAKWHQETTGQPLDPAAVSSLDAAEFRRHLQAMLKPSSVNTRLHQIKAVFAWAAESGAIERDPLRDLRQVPEGEQPVRTLDRRAVAALLREAQRGGGVRDVALITLLAQAGLRITEALSLVWDDVIIRERSGSVTVRKGKGGKTRTVPLTLTARTALTAWREARGAASGERVFPIGVRAVQKALDRYARRAGIEGRVTPHMFRHTFCKALVDAGESLDRVAVLAGHNSLNTTARYTKPTEDDLERAVSKLEWV